MRDLYGKAIIHCNDRVFDSADMVSVADPVPVDPDETIVRKLFTEGSEGFTDQFC